jgi:hypothetical protein
MAARGIPTFPCVPHEKRPLTTRGLHDASTDADLLAAWSRRWPRANLGMPTGLRSGLLVLDIDTKAADGFATLAELEQRFGALPRTLTATTPSGGEHRYFRAIDGSIRNAAGRIAGEDAPGVDVRGEGGYVLVPPSQVAGRAYVWRVRVPIAALPARWLAALRPPQREQRQVGPWSPRNGRDQSRAATWCMRALRQEADKLAAAAPGTRSDRLWRAAAALGGLVHVGAFDASEVRRALEWAVSTWQSRTPRKDADTLERGLAFGLAHPRQVELENRGAA